VGSRSDGIPISSYVVSLETANGTVLGSANSPLPANGAFITATVNFTALAGNPNLGQSLLIRLTGNEGDFAHQAQFDNVRLDGSAVGGVPEPSAIALASLGLAALGIARWGRRR
jgi:hypothetical protein